MLIITVPETEQWDEEKQEFVYTKRQTLAFEHSLVSISKWEMKWKKPFLSKKPKTEEEERDYYRCMTLTQNVDPNVYYCLSQADIETIRAYIADSMTATVFKKGQQGKKNSEIVTSELIYYWMISLNIPMECQKWHINRLMTLIKICNDKNQPGKKMSTRDVMRQNTALNAARKKKLHSTG